MGVAVPVTRLDHSSAELRSLARMAAGAVACRILAIAHVLDGASRAEAAALCGMDRQTLRDWVRRFNTDGIEGLTNKVGSGRPPALSEQRMAELKRCGFYQPGSKYNSSLRNERRSFRNDKMNQTTSWEDLPTCATPAYKT